MTRIQSDGLLLLTAIIWGSAFVAQKEGMNDVGPLMFVGLRFVLSLLIVLPLAIRESRNNKPLDRSDRINTFWLCISFVCGVVLQQVGMQTTTATNGGFLTALYVVLVPFVAWILFRHAPPAKIWPSCGLALFGVWLLNDAQLAAFKTGDWLILGSAVAYAVQVALIGFMLQRSQRPLTYCAIQYAACAVVGLASGIIIEGFDWKSISNAAIPIAYAGILSGGVAYTLQAIAQQHSPPSDAAIILSAESLFAAIAGFLLLNESLSTLGFVGCGLIFVAILFVELGPRRDNDPGAHTDRPENK